MKIEPRNFHLPLEPVLYDQLRRVAEGEGRAATSVAREAIEVYLAAKEKDRITREIEAYARAEAGTEADLSEGLEKAAVEELRRTQKARKRP